MALPIAATPVLEGKAAESFFNTVREDLKTPSYIIPTPKLDQAMALIRKHAEQRKKSSGYR